MQGANLIALTWRVRASFIRFDRDTSLHLCCKQLTNAKPDKDQECEGAEFEQHWSAKELLNEFLRIDLEKFFNEMSSWYAEYRNAHSAPVPHRIFNSLRRMQRIQEAQYLEDSDYKNASTCFPPLCSRIIDAGGDLDKCHIEKANITHDLTEAVKQALDSAISGGYSDGIYQLFFNACSLCIDSVYLDEIPDAYLPSKVFSLWAIECRNIAKVAMPALELLSSNDAADSVAPNLANYIEMLFGLNSRPELARGSEHSIAHHPLALKTPETKREFYETHFHGQLVDTQLAIDIHELAIAVLGDIIIDCLSLSKKINEPSYRDDLSSYVSLFAKLLSTGESILDVADQIRRFGELTSSKCTKHVIAAPMVQDLNSLNSLALNLIQNRLYNKVELSRNAESTIGIMRFIVNNGKYLVVDINDSDAMQEALHFQHLIDRSHSLIHSFLPKSFSAFYAHLLCEALRSGALPAKCSTCNKPFFPTGNNSKYCSRYDNETGMYCNPASNTKLKLGKKPPHATAVNLRRKADTVSGKDGHNPMAANKKRQLYFQELADAVDHTLGPYYQRSSLVPKALYEEWLKAINRPKNQPSTQTPEACGYPHPVIWNGSLADGNEVVVITTQSAQLGTLPELLDKLAEKNAGHCRKSDNGWSISKFDLVASVISLELEADKTRKKSARTIEHLPIPGLSGYWDCLFAINDHVPNANTIKSEKQSDRIGKSIIDDSYVTGENHGHCK